MSLKAKMDQSLKNKLHEIIDSLIKLSNGISEWIVTNKELDEGFSSSIEKVYQVIEIDSFEYKKFKAWKDSKYLYISRTIPWYATSDSKIIDLITIIQSITWINHLNNKEHFWLDDEYKLRRYLSKIFNNAKNEIIILDNYFDTNIFDFIDEIDDKLVIKLLGHKDKIKSGFKNTFLVSKKPNLFCKIHDTNNHSRYIVIDQSKIYTLTASINWIWKNDCDVILSENQTIIAEVNQLWNDAVNLNN